MLFSWKHDVLQQKMSDGDVADRLLQNIVGFSDLRGGLLEKYGLSFFLSHFDRTAILALGEQLPAHQPLTAEDFVRVFLLKIPHEEEETLYLALALKQLFDCVLERSSNAHTVDLTDFTAYLCEKISREDLDVVIAPKRIAPEKRLPDTARIRPIDLQPAVLVRKVAGEPPKINKDLPRLNRKLQERRGVARFFLARDGEVVAVGTLGSAIHVYDSGLREIAEVRPSECRQLQKDIGILSMAYSARSHRIGAILTNASMIFWEGGDRFATEKSICSKAYGDRIYHLDLADEWVTADKNSLYFWDLREEAVTRKVSLGDCVLVTDVCEVGHLRALCVATVSSREEKSVIVLQGGKRVGRIALGNGGCHTLHYNRLTQSLIPLGYHSTVAVYTVQGAQFDVELRSVLRGHRSIITCVDSLAASALLVTGDDTGQVRIWQLTYMRCLQSVKLSKWLGQIRLAPDRLYYSDSRINVLPLEHFAPPIPERPSPLAHFYDPRENALWLLTRKDARRVDPASGQVRSIYLLCGEEQDVSAGTRLGEGFAAGNSRGELFHYDADCNLRWQRFAHEGEVRQLQYDERNRLLFSLGADGKLIAWPERNQAQEERKTIQFGSGQVASFTISSRTAVLVAVHAEENLLSLWDYQVLKLHQVLQMTTTISTVLLSDSHDLLIVATPDKLSFLKVSRHEHRLSLSLLLNLSLEQLSQLQQLNPESQVISTLQILSVQDQNYRLLAGTSRGILFALDITALLQANFPPPANTPPRQSVNILRCQKENYESSLAQHGAITNANSLQSAEPTTVGWMWGVKVCSEIVSGLGLMGAGQNLVGVLCGEYLKLVEGQSGKTAASLNIHHPLPVKWQLQPDCRGQLKRRVYQILKILDSILKNSGYEMLAREYRLINISQFMGQIKSQHFDPPPARPSPQLLQAEYQPQDLLGQPLQQPSLKAMQAYKRVKLIQRMSEQSMQLPPVHAHLGREAQLDKDYISNLLSPAQNRSQRETQPSPLLQALNAIENRRNRPNANLQRLSSKQKILREVGNTILSKSLLVGKEKAVRTWELQEQRGVKEILCDLNDKLRNCRKKHSRPTL